MKILILGGYGVFGGRLAELLSDLAPVEMLISGRNLERASAFCDAYQGQATVRPLLLDRADIELAILAEKPQIVVDASGPFQDYGESGYHVVQACIKARIHYLDFADAADFVFGISAFDAQAKQAGIFAISGVSSFPVLTAAVLRKMAEGMDVRSVAGGIAPSPFAGIGLNVMRAVIGYAGGPVKLLRDGKQTTAIGLAESMRYTVVVPGKMPLKNIRFSLVDVPDLQVIPPEHEGMQDIWMGAGPVPEALHRMLNLLAKARATFRLPSLAPLSPLFYRILNLMKFGEHRGGMFVHVRGPRNGATNGAEIERSWHLLAEGDDGPYIPSMAIEAIIRKMLAGDVPETGARAGTHALELSDFDDLFDGRSISTGFREANGAQCLYRELLGSAYHSLHARVQQLHDFSGSQVWSGTADIDGGKGVLAKIIRKIMGFPGPASNVPLRVSFRPDSSGDGAELWTRDFDGQKFSSVQMRGTGRNEHLLIERFGPMRFAMALVVDENRLTLVQRSWSFLGIPMPKFLMPNGQAFEAEEDGKFLFSVEISMPIIGLVAAYRGTLSP